MQSDIKPFFREYLGCLGERSRFEKESYKAGFDWVIYQLALAKQWKPVRLPFTRDFSDKRITFKTETEFGIDLSFFDVKTKTLIIFVLKDEKLTNKTWTRHDFDTDIRNAASPNLDGIDLKIEKVRVVLAYNKDEHSDGVQHYTNLIQSLGTKIYDTIHLCFDRWNLERLVQEVAENLVTPNLLPIHLSGQFQYICSQFKDYDFGSESWSNLLVPHWRAFLDSVLTEPFDEKQFRLIPILLVILNDFRKESTNSYPGWIDFIEWAMLALWDKYRLLDEKRDRKLKDIVNQIWLSMYHAELEKYIHSVQKVFLTEHGFTSRQPYLSTTVTPINDAYLAFWHIGRLGILHLGAQGYVVESKEYEKFINTFFKQNAELLAKCFRKNPAALRPLIDLHHIELFLSWLILAQAGQFEEIYLWLSQLEGRLTIRRFKKNLPIPFIESCNRLDLVAEFAATSERPYNYTDSSSYLILMLLELILVFEDDRREQLIERYMKRLVNGYGDDDSKLVDEELNLMSWAPPDDWADRIFKGSVTDGIAITTGNFDRHDEKKKKYSDKIMDFIVESRKKFPWSLTNDVPHAAYILACIKNQSPLPPEFWRRYIAAVANTDHSNKE